MRVAITDANVFIDLITVELLEYLFEIDYEIHTTREVLNELFDEQKALLADFENNGELQVKVFTAQELVELQNAGFPKGLSIVDCGVLYFANLENDPLILSNDKLLRQTAKQKKLPIHGTLWILDCFQLKKICSNQLLCRALQLLNVGNYRRLPPKEVEVRLKAWA